MKVAIMQPYLFPYLGYWQLINAVDVFIVYDNIQFTKSGWFHRNNFLLNGKKKLFSLPIKKNVNTLSVNERYLAENTEKQMTKILAQIKNGYQNAPYFKKVFPIVEEIFMYKEDNLFRYIYHSIKKICNYLNIDTKIIISSTLDIDHSLKSQEKVIAINKHMKSKIYINSIGGRSLYDNERFKNENLELLFLESELPEYSQHSTEFIPYLSIIDIMMFNSKEEISNMLEKYTLVGN